MAVYTILFTPSERGLDFSMPRLYILDGGKALHAAERRHAGEAAFIQRCQVHKKRNIVDHLPDEHKTDVKRKLQNAYAMADYADAKRTLDRLHRELMDLNPSAARSLEEGMEETLTVHRLLLTRVFSARRAFFGRLPGAVPVRSSPAARAVRSADIGDTVPQSCEGFLQTRRRVGNQ
jgi:hypothetical protein